MKTTTTNAAVGPLSRPIRIGDPVFHVSDKYMSRIGFIFQIDANGVGVRYDIGNRIGWHSECELVRVA